MECSSRASSDRLDDLLRLDYSPKWNDADDKSQSLIVLHTVKNRKKWRQNVKRPRKHKK